MLDFGDMPSSGLEYPRAPMKMNAESICEAQVVGRSFLRLMVGSRDTTMLRQDAWIGSARGNEKRVQ